MRCASKASGPRPRARTLAARSAPARVRTADDVLQVRQLDARVTLGRAQRRVAEEDLDVPDVGAALEEVRRHAVPERVARHALPDPGFLRVVAHDGAHLAAVEVAAAVGDEEVRRFHAAHDRGASLPEVLVYRG